MEQMREIGTGTMAIILSVNGLLGLNLINQILAALVSILLIVYYVQKIFSKKK